MKKWEVTQIEKDSRNKIINKRGKRKQERLTKTDTEIVDALRTERKKVYRTNPDLKMVNGVDHEKEEVGLSYKKRVEVLNQCEQRYSYERWESMKVLRKCMMDREGYRVKANQVGRRNWSKERVQSYESDLRNYEQEDHDGVHTQESQKSNPSKESNGDQDQWGFWKYYMEEDAQKVVVWKKGVLYKKSIRKNEITSWDRSTYRNEIYDQRRTRKLRRRYVRDGSMVLGWIKRDESNEDSGNGKTVPERIQEVELKNRVNQKSGMNLLRERSRSKERNRERRYRTYYKYQNPEDRKKADESPLKTTSETEFQSRLRMQIGVEMKMKKLVSKPLGRTYMRSRGGSRASETTSTQASTSNSKVKRKSGRKRYVWSSQLGRLRYNQIRWKRNQKPFSVEDVKKGEEDQKSQK
jgi:hypothetical protein